MHPTFSQKPPISQNVDEDWVESLSLFFLQIGYTLGKVVKINCQCLDFWLSKAYIAILPRHDWTIVIGRRDCPFTGDISGDFQACRHNIAGLVENIKELCFIIASATKICVHWDAQFSRTFSASLFCAKQKEVCYLLAVGTLSALRCLLLELLECTWVWRIS